MARIFDVLSALLGLIVLLPVFALIAAAIKMDGRGPVFYTARRVGLNGKLFRIYKFRTMVVDAEKIGSGVTGAEDKRVTHVGLNLRRLKLDELPQLFNIVRGDMNLVGPRPEDPRFIVLYNPVQMSLLSVRPGMTSPASLRYKEEEALLDGHDPEEKYVRQVMPAKLSIDLEYFKTNTILSDLRLVLRTVADVFHLRMTHRSEVRLVHPLHDKRQNVCQAADRPPGTSEAPGPE